MFNKAVLHLDLDSFFASVEILKNSVLKGKPVIIGGSSRRGVVASCSYEARRYGVHSAMPMHMALRLCPDAIVLRGDMESYSKYSKLVTDIIAEEAPLYEKSSIDEFYLDLSGMDKHFGCYKWSKELRQKVIKHSGLPISFGLSVNKCVSKVITGEFKPNGAMQIEPGREKSFLSPLSTRKLPSVGKQTYKKLSFMGVRTIGVLGDIPARLLEREFGKNGITLWKRANAIDNSPVVPYTERKSISTERTFHKDTIDVTKLRNIIAGMAEQLAFQLRQSEKLTSCITVKIRYTDFNTYTKQCRIPYSSSDRVLRDKAHDLFKNLYDRRQLVRLVGVRVSGLVHGSYQINLFDDTLKEVSLMQQMDRIRNRFGKGSIMKASGMGAGVRVEPFLNPFAKG